MSPGLARAFAAAFDLAMGPGFLPIFDGLDKFGGVDALGVADAVPDGVTGLAHTLKAFLELLDTGVGRKQFVLGVGVGDGVVQEGHRVDGVVRVAHLVRGRGVAGLKATGALVFARGG